MAPKVIVIGAGVAGLSAACYARMSGFDVDVLERHTIPGGLCTAWRVDGFLFDGCIEWLTGSGPASPFHALWEEVGVTQGRVFIDRDAYSVTTGSDGRCVTLWADPDRLERELTVLSPEDAGVSRELCDLVRKMRHARYRVDQAPELLGVVGTFQMIRDAWPVRKMWATCTGTTVGDLAARFQDRLLRHAMQTSVPSQLQLVSLVTTLADLSNGAAGYPLGGSLPVARAMEERCLALGARVHLRRGVKSLRMDGAVVRGVELEDGRQMDADVVIAAVDLRVTLDHLLAGAFPSPVHEELFQSRELLPSVCCVSFGLRRPPAERPDAVTHRHVLREPVVVAGHRIEVLRWKSQPGDPTLAPRDKGIVVAMVDSPHAFWHALREDRSRYERAKQELALGLAALLEEAMPGFSGMVETTDVATPLTFERYTSNHQGKFMTWAPLRATRPPPQLPRQVPGVKGLYLAGMWVAPPGGLPWALRSGREAVQVMCRARGVAFRTS